jgi:hypothetical protein
MVSVADKRLKLICYEKKNPVPWLISLSEQGEDRTCTWHTSEWTSSPGMFAGNEHWEVKDF